MPSENEELVRMHVRPHSDEAEKSLLTAMLMDEKAVVTASEIITGNDFYDPQRGVVFDALSDIVGNGGKSDPTTLQEYLKRQNVPQEVSSSEYIGSLIEGIALPGNAEAYANIIAEKAVLRRLISVNEKIEAECYSDSSSLEDILGDTEAQIFSVLQKRNTSEYVPIKKIVIQALHNIEIASRANGQVTGISTGFKELDSMTAGLQPSDLILIAARPSMGKTAFALNIAEYVASNLQQTVAIFSLEMSKVQLASRLLAMESHVDSQHIRNGRLNEAEWDELIKCSDKVSTAKLIIDDTPSISIGELRSKCRKYKVDHDLKLVMIDYLQLMSGSGTGSSSDSRQQQISEISRSLKGLARELQVPVVALSQLSRAVEQRDDKHPMLSDLRESGAIEQDADVVMFIYRDDYYNKASEKKNIAEIMISKQRNGPVGTVDLVWLPQYTKFVSSTKPAIPQKD